MEMKAPGTKETDEQKQRSEWSSRLGFYLAAIGSACGLGNLWRFPYIAGQNGGGAFVLLYVLLALVVGLPLLIGELILGKTSGRGVLASMRQLQKTDSVWIVKSFRWIGRLAVVLSMVILSYYAVISGWVLHFVTQMLVGLVTGTKPSSKTMMDLLVDNGWLQILLASVHLLFTVTVVLKGVQQGLEKAIGFMMPIFGILVVGLLTQAMSLPSSVEALRFMFYPDFSKLTMSSLIQAIGHVCFTLSVGFGTMVTFGSYMRDDENIPAAGFRVTFLDTFISLASGLLIFTVAFQATSTSFSDPSLLFEVLPNFLLDMPGGILFGILFFISLYLAALGASIGLLEVIVANIEERTKKNRRFSAWICAVISLILSVIPALSSSSFKNLRYNGRGLLEILDNVLINWILPLIALGMSLIISYGLSKVQKERFFLSANQVETEALFSHWRFSTRWLIPGLIIFAFLLQILRSAWPS